jgi:hypothetical protein
MNDENDSRDRKGDTEHGDSDISGQGFGTGFARGVNIQNAKHDEPAPGKPRKPSLIVRIWHTLWRRRVWRKIAGHPHANWAEKTTVIITVGVVIVAGRQAHIDSTQADLMKSSLEQNERAIILARGQLAVADRGATTAQNALTSSNDSFKQTFSQMRAQTKASDDLATAARQQANTARDAMKATEDSAQQDRRPWVGLQNLQCFDCKYDVTIPTATLHVGRLVATIVNSGKTPALDMTFNVMTTNVPMGDPVPDYDASVEEVRKRLQAIGRTDAEPFIDLNAHEVIPPGGFRTPILVNNSTFGRETIPTKDRLLFYVVGKITYYDTRRTVRHTTKFCLVNFDGPGYGFCATGNDMD